MSTEREKAAQRKWHQVNDHVPGVIGEIPKYSESLYDLYFQGGDERFDDIAKKVVPILNEHHLQSTKNRTMREHIHPFQVPLNVTKRGQNRRKFDESERPKNNEDRTLPKEDEDGRDSTDLELDNG